MASSQEPTSIVDPPIEIVELQKTESRIVLNLRSDKWPEELVQEAKADRHWSVRRQLYHGLFMHPDLTEFLAHTPRGSQVLICCQEAKGGIATVTDTVEEIYWLGVPADAGQRGVHAQIRLSHTHTHGSIAKAIWGNYVLAIARTPKTTRTAKSMRDPDGSYFIRWLNE